MLKEWSPIRNFLFIAEDGLIKKERKLQMFIPEIGGIFRSKLTGAEYELRRITDQMAVLYSSDGLSQILTGRDNLNLFYEKVPNQKKERIKGKNKIGN